MEHTMNALRRHGKGRRRTTTIFLDLAFVFVLHAAALSRAVGWILVSDFNFGFNDIIGFCIRYFHVRPTLLDGFEAKCVCSIVIHVLDPSTHPAMVIAPYPPYWPLLCKDDDVGAMWYVITAYVITMFPVWLNTVLWRKVVRGSNGVKLLEAMELCANVANGSHSQACEKVWIPRGGGRSHWYPVK